MGDHHGELHSFGGVDGHQAHGVGVSGEGEPRNSLAVMVEVVPPGQERGHGGRLRLLEFVYFVQEIRDKGIFAVVKLIKPYHLLHGDTERIFRPNIQMVLIIQLREEFIQNIQKILFFVLE